MYGQVVYSLSYCPVSNSGKESISLGKEEWDKHIGFFATFQLFSAWIVSWNSYGF